MMSALPGWSAGSGAKFGPQGAQYAKSEKKFFNQSRPWPFRDSASRLHAESGISLGQRPDSFLVSQKGPHGIEGGENRIVTASAKLSVS
jgi:hypothetical protein